MPEEDKVPSLRQRFLPVSGLLLFIGLLGYFVDFDALVKNSWLADVQAEENCTSYCGLESGSPFFLVMTITGAIGLLASLFIRIIKS